MTEQPAQPPQGAPVPPASPVPPHQGPLEHLAARFLPHAEAVIHDAEAEGLKLTAEFSAALQGHAGEVFDIAGDVMGLLKVIDPGDAVAVEALAALIPKAVAVAGSAARLAQAAFGKVAPQG
jgi:hypothetical protein